jgi:hypothetical protein
LAAGATHVNARQDALITTVQRVNLKESVTFLDDQTFLNIILFETTGPSSCTPNTCLNGGLCYLNNSIPTCNCTTNYYGTICEKGFILKDFS